MKNLKNYLTIASIALLFASEAARADVANGTYTYSSSGTVPIWDISGEYSGTLDGLSLDFTISQNSSGHYQGQGSFSYYDDWTGDSLDGSISTVGKISGSATNPAVSMEMLISGSGTVSGDNVNFSATARIKFTVDAANGQLASTGGSMSVAVKDVTTGKSMRRSGALGSGDTFPLPSDTTGDWNLTLNLTPNGTKYSGTATLQTSAGGTMDFTATGTYSVNTDTSNIKLKGAGGELSLVVSTSGQSMSIQSMKGKVYGQSMSFKAQ